MDYELEYSSLKRFWNREIDFSEWLADEEHLKFFLKDTGVFDKTGMLHSLKREKQISKLRADLYAKDAHGNSVIIENQFREADHKHLGQLITYAANEEAKTVIWVVEKTEKRKEKAIKWLNEHIDDVSFYLVAANAFGKFVSFYTVVGDENVPQKLTDKQFIEYVTCALLKNCEEWLNINNEFKSIFGEDVVIFENAKPKEIKLANPSAAIKITVDVPVDSNGGSFNVDMIFPSKNTLLNFVDNNKTAIYEIKGNKLRVHKKVKDLTKKKALEATFAWVAKQAIDFKNMHDK